MCAQAPFTPPVFQALRESRRVTQKAEEHHADLLQGGKDPACLLYSLLALTVQQTTQISTIGTACSPQCNSLFSPLQRPERITVTGGREPSMSGATVMF